MMDVNLEEDPTRGAVYGVGVGYPLDYETPP